MRLSVVDGVFDDGHNQPSNVGCECLDNLVLEHSIPNVLLPIRVDFSRVIHDEGNDSHIHELGDLHEECGSCQFFCF